MTSTTYTMWNVYPYGSIWMFPTLVVCFQQIIKLTTIASNKVSVIRHAVESRTWRSSYISRFYMNAIPYPGRIWNFALANRCTANHYSDVIISAIVSQITSLKIVYSTIYSSADQRKLRSSASLAFVRGIHRWPVNFPHKGPVTRKMLPFDDVILQTLSELRWRRVACRCNLEIVPDNFAATSVTGFAGKTYITGCTHLSRCFISFWCHVIMLCWLRWVLFETTLRWHRYQSDFNGLISSKILICDLSSVAIKNMPSGPHIPLLLTVSYKRVRTFKRWCWAYSVFKKTNSLPTIAYKFTRRVW